MASVATVATLMRLPSDGLQAYHRERSATSPTSGTDHSDQATPSVAPDRASALMRLNVSPGHVSSGGVPR